MARGHGERLWPILEGRFGLSCGFLVVLAAAVSCVMAPSTVSALWGVITPPLSVLRPVAMEADVS